MKYIFILIYGHSSFSGECYGIHYRVGQKEPGDHVGFEGHCVCEVFGGYNLFEILNYNGQKNRAGKLKIY